MPLYILLLLVVGGISGVALLLHVLGKSKPVVLSANDARTAWLRLFPDDTISDIKIAENGRAALIATEHGPGLVWSFGIDTVARYLTDFSLSETKTRLKVKFHDFSAPKVSLTLTETERAIWREWMVPT